MESVPKIDSMGGISDWELAERVFGVRLRADAYAKAVEVLEAADRLLRVNPTATLEEIAREAGASRATIYRRFPTRADLLVALSRWAVGRIVSALEDAQIGVLPAKEALYRATLNVIEAKVGLEYTRTLTPADDPLVAKAQERMRGLAIQLLTQCRTQGLIASEADLEWVLTVFYALVHEAAVRDVGSDEMTPEKMAAQVLDTLLHGVGTTTGVDDEPHKAADSG